MTLHTHIAVCQRGGFASYAIGVSEGNGPVVNLVFGCADDRDSAWERVGKFMRGRYEAGRAHRGGSPLPAHEGPGSAGGALGGPFDEGFA